MSVYRLVYQVQPRITQVAVGEVVTTVALRELVDLVAAEQGLFLESVPTEPLIQVAVAAAGEMLLVVVQAVLV